MSDKPRVLLIDLSALFHPAWRANENGPLSVAFEGTLGGVRRCIAACEPGALVAVCCDGRGNWRKELTPTYKAHREALPNVFYAEFDRVKARLKADGLLLWQVDGYEADDLIAQATGEATRAGHPVRIASHDKDMLQFVGSEVEYLSTSSYNLMDAAKVREKFGVEPSQIGDWLALVGDKSDGVAGCPGCGPVNAAKLLNAYGNLTELGLALASEPEKVSTPKMVEALKANWPQIELARKLVSFKTDAPISFEEIYEERKPQPLTKGDDVGDIFDRADELDSTKVEIGDAQEAAPPQGLAGAALAPGDTRDAQKEQGIVRVSPPEIAVTVEYTKQLEPRTFRETLIACRVLFESRLYQKYKSPEAMAAVVLRGREMGYGAGASLDGFHVIEQTGQLAMHAHMIIDRAMLHPDCAYLDCLESDAVHAVYEGKKKSSNRPFRLEYTIEQAKLAGLVRSRSNWELRPTEQLRKTAGVQCSRVLWPGAAMGLYALCELGENDD